MSDTNSHPKHQASMDDLAPPEPGDGALDGAAMEKDVVDTEGHMRHWLAPVLVALIGAFMSILDSSIVNVAVPTIMNVFNAGPSDVQWVSTIYLLAMGVVVPLSGWLGDRFGFKKLYMVSLAAFVLGSLFCGVSWDLNSLIVFRVMQAIGGGMIMPTMMAMIFRIVPRDKIGGAMGVFGIALMVGPAIGPTLGGYLVEYVNWRWIFTINLPIGVVGILLAWFVLPDFQSKHPGKLDMGGAFSSAVMLFSLLLALSKGEDWGWTDERIVILFAVSFFAFVLFLVVELTSKNPLLELRVFKYRSFLMSNLLVVVTTVGMYAGIFYLPLFLQNIRGLGAMQTGLLLMPGALASGLMMPITGKLYDKIGPRPLVIFGVLMLAFLTFQFHNLNLQTATGTIIVWVTLRGMVMAFANMPAQTAALVDVPTELIGRASSISNIIRSVAGSFGLAVLTSILTMRQAFHGARLTWTLVPGNPTVDAAVSRISTVLGGGPRGHGMALAYLKGLITQSSFISGIDDVFIAAAAFTLIAFLPALFMRQGSGPAGGPRAPMAE
ncbi:MAG TPA: DHA2 family efflux MFS transporter permease subunit [Rectinemataceae bacterium]|nr:DHA2 family efflux MFS transporter permease subunit [Rectinemataceae bacterium]